MPHFNKFRTDSLLVGEDEHLILLKDEKSVFFYADGFKILDRKFNFGLFEIERVIFQQSVADLKEDAILSHVNSVGTKNGDQL